MKTIKLEFDFLIGPIVKDLFSASKNKLVTGVDVIDDDSTLNELNEKACALYSACYEFDSEGGCVFNSELAKQHKDELSDLMSRIIKRLSEVNNGSFEVQDLTASQLTNIP